MINTKGSLGIVVLVAAQWGTVVACSSTDGGDGAGGSPATGGTSSGGSGGAASGGAGGSVPTCETFHPDEGECGTCEESLEDFCENGANPCNLPDDLVCRVALPTTTLYEGCGYARRESVGDVGDSWTHVWSQATGELVFYTSSYSNSDGCYPTRIVGEMPNCDDWEEACDGFGGGGAGGEGGGTP